MHYGMDLHNDLPVSRDCKQHKLFVVSADDKLILRYRLLLKKQYECIYQFHPLGSDEIHMIANGLKQDIACAVIATPKEAEELDQFTANNLGAPEHWSVESACKSFEIRHLSSRLTDKIQNNN